jgi:hypothetical protein
MSQPFLVKHRNYGSIPENRGKIDSVITHALSRVPAEPCSFTNEEALAKSALGSFIYVVASKQKSISGKQRVVYYLGYKFRASRCVDLTTTAGEAEAIRAGHDVFKDFWNVSGQPPEGRYFEIPPLVVDPVAHDWLSSLAARGIQSMTQIDDNSVVDTFETMFSASSARSF